MADLTIHQKKELAQRLYTRDDLTQKEVAGQVGVSVQTMSKWVREEGWDQIRTSITATRDNLITSTILQISELDNAIKARPEGMRYPSSKEADTRRKLTADLEALEKEMGVVESLNVIRDITRWVRKNDLSKAQELSGLFDAYIKDKIR